MIFEDFDFFFDRAFEFCCEGLICFASFFLQEKVEIFNLHEKTWNFDGALVCLQPILKKLF